MTREQKIKLVQYDPMGFDTEDIDVENLSDAELDEWIDRIKCALEHFGENSSDESLLEIISNSRNRFLE